VELGRVGVWSSAFGLAAASAAREAAVEIEELGYGALWYPESVGSKEALSQGAMLLGWTSRIVVATGIANLYARDAMASANGARGLSEAYPGRFLFGLGVSHAPSVGARGSEYGKPVTTMRAYLDAMDSAPYRAPAPAEAPVVLAALGPKMIDLAAERTRGAHPYFVPPEHTASARERMGPGPLLLPEQAVLLETDPAKARAAAREHMHFYLELDNYRRSLLRLGFDDEELSEGGSNRLVDAVVAWGDVDAIRDRVRAHLDAGADHVCIQALGSGPAEPPLAALRELAPALLEL
jgi:probable F420-dependent oxidoreductase